MNLGTPRQRFFLSHCLPVSTLVWALATTNFAQSGSFPGPSVPATTQLPPSSSDCVLAHRSFRTVCTELAPEVRVSSVPWTCMDGSTEYLTLTTTTTRERCEVVEVLTYEYIGSQPDTACASERRFHETFFRIKSVRYVYSTPTCVPPDGDCCIVTDSISHDIKVGEDTEVLGPFTTTEPCPDGEGERTVTTTITNHYDRMVTETLIHQVWICEGAPSDCDPENTTQSEVFSRFSHSLETIERSACPGDEEFEVGGSPDLPGTSSHGFDPSPRVLAGSGINLDTLSAGEPSPGRVWRASIGVVAPHTPGIAYLFVTESSRAGTLLGPRAELLLGGRRLLFLGPTLHAGQGTKARFAVSIPLDATLVGRTWAAQGAVLGGFLGLTNGLTGLLR